MKKQAVAFEVLKMARELVLNEHTDRRAQLHNSWLVESQNLWASQRTRLAYPEIPAYPTEAEILARAERLMNFLYSSEHLFSDSVAEESQGEVSTEPQLEVSTDIVAVTESDPEPEINIASDPEPEPESVPGPEPEPDPEPEPQGMFPNWKRRLNELRFTRRAGYDD